MFKQLVNIILKRLSLLAIFTLCFSSIHIIAQNKSDSLAEIIKLETDLLKKSQLLNELANEVKTKNLPAAIDYATQAYKIAEANGFKRESGMSCSTLGLLYSYTTKLDSAIYWNKRGITNLLFTKDSLEISRNYNRLGVDYLLNGEHVGAVKYLLLAVRWANTTKIKANAYNNLGMISKKNGDYAKAVAYYFKALQEYELVSALNNQAKTLSNLGSLYIQRKEYKKAKSLYEESYAITQKTNDSDCLGQALNGLGITTNRLGDHKQALIYFNESAGIYKALGLKNEYAQQIINIADLHGELGKYKEAELEYFEAEKIFVDMNDSLNLSAVYNNLGELFYTQKVFKKAAYCFEKSYSYSQGFKDLNYNKLIIKNLSSIYETLGEEKKALKYRKIYEEMNDKMVNVAENVKLVELNHVYETNKKEKQIIQKNEQINQLQSNKKYTYWVIIFLASAVLLILFLYRNRIKRQQKLEENIHSIDNQISSLKIENSDLKSKLIQTELELKSLETKYSKDKEQLPENHVSLSKREYEVLLFIAEGLSDKEIAEKIFVSITTVRTHIRRIYDKLLVKNRTEAIMMLHKYQLTNEAA